VSQCLLLAALSTPRAALSGSCTLPTANTHARSRRAEAPPGHTHPSRPPARLQAEAFKQAVLYPHIAQRDAEQVINMLWLKNLTEGSFK
jgi:hypothetical protein